MPEQYTTLLWHRLLLALRQASALPVRIHQPITEQDEFCAVSFYPLAGLIQGVILFLLAWIFQRILPQSALYLDASLVLAFWLWLRGARGIEASAHWLTLQSSELTNKNKDWFTSIFPIHTSTNRGLLMCINLLLRWSTLVYLYQHDLIWQLVWIPVVPMVFILMLRVIYPLQSTNNQLMVIPPQIHVNTILLISLLTLLYAMGWLFVISGFVLSLTGLWLFSHFRIKNTLITQYALIEISEILILIVTIIWN